MNNLVEVVGLDSLLEKSGVRYEQRNFEDVYSDLYAESRHEALLHQLEMVLHDYFAELQLPDEPTLYDHLVLSLRSKDVIATFNWDPFLWRAAMRNHRFAESPHLLFLHGNVAVGYCPEDQQKGPVGGRCSVCRKRFQRSPLLYPVSVKDYSANPYIQSEWATLEEALEHAYVLTIFGYGAPTTDGGAIQLMKHAWGEVGKRNLEEVEMIDIIGEDELARRWRAFIHSHHYRTAETFDRSWIARHPRRTCETMWRMLMEVEFPEDNFVPQCLEFRELHKWLEPLVEAEGGNA